MNDKVNNLITNFIDCSNITEQNKKILIFIDYIRENHTKVKQTLGYNHNLSEEEHKFPYGNPQETFSSMVFHFIDTSIRKKKVSSKLKESWEILLDFLDCLNIYFPNSYLSCISALVLEIKFTLSDEKKKNLFCIVSRIFYKSIISHPLYLFSLDYPIIEFLDFYNFYQDSLLDTSLNSLGSSDPSLCCDIISTLSTVYSSLFILFLSFLSKHLTKFPVDKATNKLLKGFNTSCSIFAFSHPQPIISFLNTYFQYISHVWSSQNYNLTLKREIIQSLHHFINLHQFQIIEFDLSFFTFILSSLLTEMDLILPVSSDLSTIILSMDQPLFDYLSLTVRIHQYFLKNDFSLQHSFNKNEKITKKPRIPQIDIKNILFLKIQNLSLTNLMWLEYLYITLLHYPYCFNDQQVTDLLTKIHFNLSLVLHNVDHRILYWIMAVISKLSSCSIPIHQSQWISIIQLLLQNFCIFRHLISISRLYFLTVTQLILNNIITYHHLLQLSFLKVFWEEHNLTFLSYDYSLFFSIVSLHSFPLLYLPSSILSSFPASNLYFSLLRFIIDQCCHNEILPINLGSNSFSLNENNDIEVPFIPSHLYICHQQEYISGILCILCGFPIPKIPTISIINNEMNNQYNIKNIIDDSELNEQILFEDDNETWSQIKFRQHFHQSRFSSFGDSFKSQSFYIDDTLNNITNVMIKNPILCSEIQNYLLFLFDEFFDIKSSNFHNHEISMTIVLRFFHILCVLIPYFTSQSKQLLEHFISILSFLSIEQKTLIKSPHLHVLYYISQHHLIKIIQHFGSCIYPSLLKIIDSLFSPLLEFLSISISIDQMNECSYTSSTPFLLLSIVHTIFHATQFNLVLSHSQHQKLFLIHPNIYHHLLNPLGVRVCALLATADPQGDIFLLSILPSIVKIIRSSNSLLMCRVFSFFRFLSVSLSGLISLPDSHDDVLSLSKTIESSLHHFNNGVRLQLLRCLMNTMNINLLSFNYNFLINFLNDEDYTVRLVISNNFSNIFKEFESPDVIFIDIFNKLKNNIVNNFSLESTLQLSSFLSLCNLSRIDHKYFLHILWFFFSLPRKNQALLNLVELSIKKMVIISHSYTIYNVLMNNLDFLFSNWLENHWDPVDFFLFLNNYSIDNTLDIISDQSEMIICFLVRYCSFFQISSFFQSLNINFDTFLTQNILSFKTAIFNSLAVFDSISCKEYHIDRINNIHKQLKKISSFSSENQYFNEIVNKMLDFTLYQTCGSFEIFSSATAFSLSIEYISFHLYQKNAINVFLFCNDDRIEQILLHFHILFFKTLNSNFLQNRIAELFSYFYSIIFQRTYYIPSVFCFLLNLLIFLLNFSELNDFSFHIIESLISNSLQNNPIILIPHFRYLVNHLVEYCESNLNDPSRNKILNLLISPSVPSCLNDVLSTLEPLPDHSFFSHLIHIANSYRTDMNLRDFLKKFLESNGKSVFSDRKSHHKQYIKALKYLLSQIKKNKEELYQMIQSNNSIISRIIGWSVTLINQDNEEIKKLVSIVLGEIGCIDQGLCNHDMFGFFENHIDSCPPSRDIILLEHLLEYLTGNDPFIIKSALLIIKTILITYPDILSEESSNHSLEYHTITRQYNQSHFVFLKPFFNVSIPNNFSENIDYKNPEINLNDISENLWFLHEHGNFNQWICNLTSQICRVSNDSILKSCSSLTNQREEFALLIFPVIFYDLVSSSDINSSILVDRFNKVLSFTDIHVRILQLLLFSLHLIRQARIKNSFFGQKSDYSKIMKRFSFFENHLNLLLVAESAQKCGLYLTSLLYLELWHEYAFGQIVIPSLNSFHKVEFQNDLDIFNTMKQKISIHESIIPSEFQKMVEFYGFSFKFSSDILSDFQDFMNIMIKKFYSLWEKVIVQINDQDGIYGVQAGLQSQSIQNVDLTSKLELQMLEHQHKWDNTLPLYDLYIQNSINHQEQKDQLSFPFHNIPKINSELKKGLLVSLKGLGCFHLIHQYFFDYYSKENQDKEIIEYFFENAWKICCWDIETSNFNIEDLGFNGCIYLCLKSITQHNQGIFQENLQKARKNVECQLDFIGPEYTKAIIPSMIRLQMLDVLDKSWLDICQEKSENHNDDSKISNNNFFNLFDSINCKFSDIESLLSLFSVINIMKKDYQKAIECMIFLSKQARLNGWCHIASYSLHQATFYSQNHPKYPILLALAQLYYSNNQQTQAIHVLKSIKNQNFDKNIQIKFDIYLLLADWLSELQVESTDVILSYLNSAFSLTEQLSTKNTASNICKVSFQLAIFHERMFNNIIKKHREWQIFEDTDIDLTKGQNLTDEVKKFHQNRLKQNRAIASKYGVVSNLNNSLIDSLKYYCICLTNDNQYDLVSLFHLINIWFNNCQYPEVVYSIQKYLFQIPPHKFLPLIYQIASRMSEPIHNCDNEDTQIFHSTIFKLVLLICKHYPHQSLFQIFSLFNGDNLSGADKKFKQAFVANQERKKAAFYLLNQLRTKKNYSKIIEAYEHLINAYIQIASTTVTDVNQWPKNINTFLLGNINNQILQHLSVATRTPLMHDESPVMIAGWRTQIEISKSGRTKPKIIICLGSDGNEYQQLIKFGDDLRQDAVMEQVFLLINRLLQTDGCGGRNLSLRYYNVIPLTPLIGIVEYVQDCLSLSEYLVKNTSKKICAHERFRKNDWKHSKCIDLMRPPEKGAYSHTLLYEKYQDICQHFKPVFHHFFLENFINPFEWFEKRQNYNRSAAVNSIAGYILGLGDRHLQNILIDTNTSHLIHIDLGIAFDQGLALPTPELVPFRLTRDMIDGMGLSGIEGIFRRCCEETLRVLRHSSDMISTLIEVFLHDPLFKWCLNIAQLAKRQNIDSLSSLGTNEKTEKFQNDQAYQVLLVLKQKLSGNEGPGQPLSIAGQVNKLIFEASDPKKLCSMYAGWSSWC